MGIVKDSIKKVVERENLTEEEALACVLEIMEGEATPAQIASLLTALRMKGETVEELTGFARGMREKCVRVYPDRTPLVDTCGTGGDKLQTFNVSTTAAFVAAGAGVAVAKHGNRSVSSKCGSADVLEALGVKLDVGDHLVTKCIEEIGIGFLFAPRFHPAMKYAVEPRRDIGLRTIFNLLGPLTNPAGAKAQVLGVYSASLTEPLAHVLQNTGCEHAFVVHGVCGLDEMSVCSETKVSEVHNGKVETYLLKPEDAGLPMAREEDILGGTVSENAEILKAVLQGEKGPRRDMVLLNAGAALCAAGKAKDLKEGIQLAAQSIDSGEAFNKLQQLIEKTNVGTICH